MKWGVGIISCIANRCLLQTISTSQILRLMLGKLSKQIFGKSWEFGPTGFQNLLGPTVVIIMMIMSMTCGGSPPSDDVDYDYNDDDDDRH